ncbi:HAD family hydrolase [Pelovirga terrestris]|uniref:HAD family phosphatase n=1 Tax=Pelovirga terrestris TaxID=2771352 RepID=A0A8J6QVA8_9BACT|nr:HAD family phosphatase [Pelovirga terrestris]MBD1401480.1 HAD family phosphatase [Pelovirga terrestris]
MKKIILFDHDGVLVNTEHWYYLANKRALAELDIDLPLPVYLELMADGTKVWTLAQAVGIDDQQIATARARRDNYYQQYLITEDIEIDGVTETLKELSAVCRMAIVTTSRRVDFELIHRHRQLIDYMDFILTVEDYPRAKPYPDPYLSALRRFQVTADQAIVVEDSARGLKSAVAAGVDCIVVHNEFTASHDLSAATLKIADIRELPVMMKALI